MNLKNILKLPWYFIRNLQYNRQTSRVMKRILKPGSNCIDIGCHKGKILDKILVLAPSGTHWAFEPLPGLFEGLLEKYKGRNVTLSPRALSDGEGDVLFHHVINSPGYSGFRKRTYHIPSPRIEEIKVRRIKLDIVIPANCKIDFIKIDVEGAELEVLRGADLTIKRNKPFIIFEHGKGAAPFYGTSPEAIYDLLSLYELKIATLKNWIKGRSPLSRHAFSRQFYKEMNYYFIAYPT